MGHWFEVGQVRLDIERQELLEKGFVLDEASFQRGRVEFTGAIHDGHSNVPIRIICQEGFPYRIPLFIAPELALTPNSKHIAFRTRSICLRSSKPLEWNNCHHIADLIPDAERILKGQHTGDFGEEHVAPDQDLFPTRRSKQYMLLPGDLKNPPNATSFKVRASAQWSERVMYVFQSGQEKTNLNFNLENDIYECVVFSLKEMPLATIVQLDDILHSTCPNYSHLIPEMLNRYAIDRSDTIGQFNNLTKRKGNAYFGVVFPYQTGWYWQFFKLEVDKKRQVSIIPIGTSGFDALVSRVSGVVNTSRLDKKTVLIAGCGGIGSTIAVELACAGIGKLFLNDPDTISPANVVRHECSLAVLGSQKSHAVKSKIAMKTPLTRVIASADIFLDEEFEQKIVESDLVICAIGDYNTDEYLNEICTKHKKPIIYAYIGVYGAMGHIVRLSTQGKETGCFRCFQKYLSKGIPDLPEIEDVNLIKVELGCNNPSLPAASFDQRTIALFAVRKAIQNLDPSSYCDDEADAIVFYARHLENVVKPSLKIEKFSVPAIEDCSICGGAPQ